MFEKYCIVPMNEISCLCVAGFANILFDHAAKAMSNVIQYLSTFRLKLSGTTGARDINCFLTILFVYGSNISIIARRQVIIMAYVIVPAKDKTITKEKPKVDRGGLSPKPTVSKDWTAMCMHAGR